MLLNMPSLGTRLVSTFHPAYARLVRLRVFLPVELGGIHHVGQRRLRLLPLPRLEPTIGVHPQLLRAEVLQHLLDAVLDLLLARYARAVDIVDTRADMSWVSLVDENLQELGIALAILDTQHVSIKR